MLSQRRRSKSDFHYYLLFCLLLVVSAVGNAYSADGDIKHIMSHDKTLVVTNPATGSNSYPKWVKFPAPNEQYRKVTLWITYARPDSLHCGEWDYIDRVMLKRPGSDTDSTKDIELARMISPYGWRFDSGWKFTWHIDITDFALLLHDSVEIEFVHTGYEGNTDRGWLITLDFEFEQGHPAMNCLGMEPLWSGSFPYGDSTKDIESLLHPIALHAPAGSDYARLRITQTGHGMDDSANCAEFCAKYRQVIFDDSIVDKRTLWRKCGDNPLYPQSGTWIFNRANWCPGGVVYPDIYDLPTKNTEAHTIDIAMEPYLNPNKPSANWYIHAYMFYYKTPTAKNDVSVEEITSPSNLDENSRTNPACDQLRFIMKNNGSAVIKSVTVIYGIVGQKEHAYAWTGHLESQQLVNVALFTDLQIANRPESVFVRLEKPNGSKDEYPLDNISYSVTSPVAVYPTSFVLELRTNRDAGETAYRVTDTEGKSVRERVIGSLAAYSTYVDTLSLDPGCYRLEVADTSGDGLAIWCNPEAGRGYARLLDLNGHLLRDFNSDFGSSIVHSFTTSTDPKAITADSAVCLVYPFPPRNDGKFDVEVFFNEPAQATLRVESDSSNSIVFSKDLTNFKSGLVPVDISKEPDGTYRVIVKAEGGVEVTQKVRLKR